SMRGGVFPDEHRVSPAAVERFVTGRNRDAAARFGAAATGVEHPLDIGELAAVVQGDADLERLAAEYLPLVFSRRHGDPSRP
ncbi:MAG: hypothetical protein GWN07_20845, partial [Actinobacteria bacterium]|nr:hypothetical protein [Actinomycetota bacterium]NIS32902.1 hypothetical protein [Actinomycetota bacterium]NIU67865.1 hypothetical protein [Actinomycetota bacterium]NIV88215.1 hypothetical protein [Actinomycetota bacterium]NIW29642.1 hypothetical protein [Actinomycetota bacterium]